MSSNTTTAAASSDAPTLETQADSKNGVKRFIFAIVAIVVQVIVYFILFLYLESYWKIIDVLIGLAAVVLVLGIYSQNKTSAMKVPWMVLILAVPILGVLLYLFIGFNGRTKKMSERYAAIDEQLYPLLPRNEEVQQHLAKRDKRAANIAHYIYERSHYPAYENTDITYYDDAAAGLEAQKAELRRAQKFIFMEYHAIENAESWWGIQEILEERVAAGVEVRVFYDDMGSIGFINTDFVDLLESRGIRCRVFNPFSPGLNLFLNNRDHRKITVVDGKVGFTGGYNLANEYFNLTHPFGEWKDTGIRLEGDAVKSLTVAFLEMWNAGVEKVTNDTDFAQYLPDYDYQAKEHAFVVPYADSPMDDEQVGEDVYISVAEYAQDYAYFVTPYLIITDEMTHALGLAAKRGVDVRVITPGIPDKKLVYSITRSYYHSLVRNGVRIFEWSPGFNHSKMSVADDKIATCGTINLDYRSLYHHFENGCLYADCDAVIQTREDFEATFAQCREVTEEYANPDVMKKFSQLILRFIAPLM
ncbi:MAG: cardiolipin synthase [Coriobacteriales bacterium]|nr:cardiolipin synthase [Coriobacteriales bacterium]